MISRNEVKEPKKRILMTCVKMFIEKGFNRTTMLDIIKEADVSAGTFQNIFHTKDGVLLELVKVMFDNQFYIAKMCFNKNMPLIMVYAIETSLQLVITELNENLRDIYIEAYTQDILINYINEKTTDELIKIFKSYNPYWSESKFYEVEIGTSGLMRSYMAKKCDKYFTLKNKTECFLRMAFDIFHVNKKEQDEVIKKLFEIDIIAQANKVMDELFRLLEMQFDFKFA